MIEKANETPEGRNSRKAKLSGGETFWRRSSREGEALGKAKLLLSLRIASSASSAGAWSSGKLLPKARYYFSHATRAQVSPCQFFKTFSKGREVLPSSTSKSVKVSCYHMTFEWVCRMGTLARPGMSGKSAQPTIHLSTTNRYESLSMNRAPINCQRCFLHDF